MIEFYLILSAVNRNISGMMFWRLLLGTVAMLAAGYSGEAGFVNPMMGFVVGMMGWGFILFEFWITLHSSPILYRYIDWSITVPLQMIEFYLILSAVNRNISGMMFWRLLLGTVAMLAAGYSGEAGFVNPMMGFVVGMAG